VYTRVTLRCCFVVVITPPTEPPPGTCTAFCFYCAMLCVRGTSLGPVSVCLSVCLSQVGVLSKGMNGIISFLAWGLLSTSPTLSFEEIRVSTKIRALPSGTFS